jgi:GDP-L-fucose synthase
LVGKYIIRGKYLIKLLVTGASGMVGRNIVEYLDKTKYDILAPQSQELNLLNRIEVDAYIKKYAPEIIIHCAGVVGGIQANIAQPVKFLVDNTKMGLNIIVSAYEHNVKKFINMGSSCMYPRKAKNPLNEELILQGELEQTNEGYALAKITATRLCEYIYREDSSFEYKTVIPCNLYGKYDKFDSKHSHMLPAVIKKIDEAKKNNSFNVDIWGDGEVRREFMYAEDLADFIAFALENFDRMPQNINVGLGHDYTINEYYQAIAKVIGYKGKFVHDLTKPVGMKQKLIDDTKLKEFGWSHKTKLEDGIEKTYQYYIQKVLNDK